MWARRVAACPSYPQTGRRGRPRPAVSRRAPSAASRCCTTRRQNTHVTESVDQREVVYPWHPLGGRVVFVREVIEKASGAFARCRELGDRQGRVLEVPVWIVDAAACRTVRRAASPVADLRALVALRVLLSESGRSRSSAEASRRLAIASPDRNRGDCHGAPAPPDQKPKSLIGPLRDGMSESTCRDTELERVADGDAARVDRSDGTTVRRSRRRRRRRSAGGRR